MRSMMTDWQGLKLAEGRYAVTEKLGEGGMGTVYRAWDVTLGTDVVIKVPKRSMLDDPEFTGRFQREIRAMVQLSHPNIVKVQDVGECEGLPYCVMQFLSGGDLKGKFARREDGAALPMPVESLRQWLPGIADALDFIHEKKFVHRDVKPPNILFDASGNAYLSDFGVAKVTAEKTTAEVSLTGTGMVLGTPEYMAPEMVLGEKFDGRADQYALAVTVYESLAGFPPITGPTPSAILVKQTTEAPRPLYEVTASVPRELSDAVMQALAKKPEERFPNCQTFARMAIAGLSGTLDPAALREAGAIFGSAFGTARLAATTEKSPQVDNAGVTIKLVISRRLKKWMLAVVGLLAVLIPLGLLVSDVGEDWRDWLSSGGEAVASEVASLWEDFWANPESIHLKDVQLTAKEIDQAKPMAQHLEQYDFKNTLGMEMVCVSPGKYFDSDQRPAEISEPFWIARKEVTVAQYLYYCESSTKGASEYPVWLRGVSDVDSLPREYASSRNEILCNGVPVVGLQTAQMQGFCDWLSNPGEPLKYSLPSPEQWVCAYRAGTKTKFFWSDDFDKQYAWLNVSKLAMAGKSMHNPWKLEDMAGNVWEMTKDSGKVFGGAWDSPDFNDALPKAQFKNVPAPNIGFRVVGRAK